MVFWHHAANVIQVVRFPHMAPSVVQTDIRNIRVVINGKAGKAAALPKFSDTLTLSINQF